MCVCLPFSVSSRTALVRSLAPRPTGKWGGRRGGKGVSGSEQQFLVSFRFVGLKLKFRHSSTGAVCHSEVLDHHQSSLRELLFETKTK
jgi:hypothetical protein